MQTFQNVYQVSLYGVRFKTHLLSRRHLIYVLKTITKSDHMNGNEANRATVPVS